MKIGVIGTGYVGLVAGTCFAETGNDVICMDVDQEKIGRLQRGRIPIYEPGLEELVRRNVDQGRLNFTSNLARVVSHSRVIFIAVGTPSMSDGGSDLSRVLNVAESIAEVMDGYRIIVVKSTVPVGTGDRIEEAMAAGTATPFDVVSNPEFLKEGAAVADFMKPDRVVIGSQSPEASEVIQELYSPFTLTGGRILQMDRRSAEMTKYAANAMLASRVSFMNEIANLCERVGADINRVRRGVGMDRRIGPYFLFPGPGYGGSCFPKDVRALVRIAKDENYPLKLIPAIERVNEIQKQVLAEKVLRFFTSDFARKLDRRGAGGSRKRRPKAPGGAPLNDWPAPGESPDLAPVRLLTGPAGGSRGAGRKARFNRRALKGRKIAIWGLAFKPETDDMREAPSRVILDELLRHGAEIQAYDPEAAVEARRIFGKKIRLARTPYGALKGADALVLITEWNVFRNPDFDKMMGLMKHPVIFDGRNQYDPQEMRDSGFLYFCLGVGRI